MKTLSVSMTKLTVHSELFDPKKFQEIATKEMLLTHARQGGLWDTGKAWDGQAISGDTYSFGYANLRQERGRQTARVDLQFTGQLRQAILPISTDNDGATIQVSPTPRKPDRQSAKMFGSSDSPPNNSELYQDLVGRGYNVPFSEFGKADEQRIESTFEKEFDAILEKAFTTKN